VQYPTLFRVRDGLRTAAALGANVVRAHSLGVSIGNTKSFEPTLGAFSPEATRHLATAISEATQLGLRLVIPLVDNWNYYTGGKYTFVQWHNISGANASACLKPAAADPAAAGRCAFYLDPAVISTFKAYITALLAVENPATGLPLREDPTVLCWETGNELVGVPTAWTAEISAHIKQNLGARQLVMDGRDAVRMGPDPDVGHLPDVDIVTEHYYPMNSALLTADAATARHHGKAFVVGEFGWTKGNLSAFLTAASSGDVSGWLYWSLFPHADNFGFVEHNDGFTLHYPGDTPDMQERVIVMREQSFKMRGQPVAPFSPPLIKPIVTFAESGCIAWRGATLASNYSVEVSGDKGATWASVCDRCATDAAGPVQLPRAVLNGSLIRVRGFSIDGDSAGPYSDAVTVGSKPGTPCLYPPTAPPTKPHPPPAPPSGNCLWQADTDYQPTKAGCMKGPCNMVAATSREACCGACAAKINCLVGVYQESSQKCFLKPVGSTPVHKQGVTSCRRNSRGSARYGKCTTWYDATPHVTANKVHRDVKQFGAIGDGRTDDTQAIQAAINAHRGKSLQKTPAAVYFPPGEYLVSDTLVTYFHTYLFGPPSGWSTQPECRATLVLAEGAPGFNSTDALKPLIATDNGFNRSMDGEWWTDPVNKVRVLNNKTVGSRGQGSGWLVGKCACESEREREDGEHESQDRVSLLTFTLFPH